MYFIGLKCSYSVQNLFSVPLSALVEGVFLNRIQLWPLGLGSDNESSKIQNRSFLY